MCYAHGILDFIRARLDEAVEEGVCTRFTANQVWLTVQECHAPDDMDWQAFTQARCRGCWDHYYPCKKTRLVAESWSNHEEFDENWRIQ